MSGVVSLLSICVAQLPQHSQSYVACVFPLQELYAESIDYTNRIEGTSVSSGQLRLARASQRELPVLTKGAHILVLSPDEALHSGERGERSPFWVAQLEEDEDAPLGKRSSPHNKTCLMCVYACTRVARSTRVSVP